MTTSTDDYLIEATSMAALGASARWRVGTETTELARVTEIPNSQRPWDGPLYVIRFRSESGDLVTLPEINPTITLDAAVVVVALACPGAQRVRA